MSYHDFIIAGSGASGLGLAYQMSMSALRDQSMLIVDRDLKDRNDRTWCFWSDGPTRYDHLVYRYWEQLEVVSDHFHQVYDLKPYQYKMIRGIDYYRELRKSMASLPQIEFLQGRVTDLTDTKDKQHAQVIIDDVPYGARWAFNSIFKPSEPYNGPRGYHYLKQHCKSWEIETPIDCFHPQTVTLFDFRTLQKGMLRYFTILPFTQRRAFVGHTICSTEVMKPHEYDRAISEYLDTILKIEKYRILSIETGVIPMTDRPFPRKLGERIMAIGAKGGMVQPSTGYAFRRIQKDGAAIVKSLTNYGSPFQIPETPARYRLFNTLMLQMMYRQGDRMRDLFIQLFKNNSIQQIFRFLDEEATASEHMRLLTSLPALPFLNALFRVKLLRKV